PQAFPCRLATPSRYPRRSPSFPTRRSSDLAPVAAHQVSHTPVAQVTPADWEEGLRSYFVLTDPADVEAAKKAVVDNGGTVFAAYDKIGVVVAHAKGEKFADAVRGAAGVQAVGATRTSDVPKEA